MTRFDETQLPDVIGRGAKDRQRLERLRHNPLVVSGGGIVQDSPNAVLLRCKDLLGREFATRSCLLGISADSGVSYGWRSKWRLRQCFRQFETIYTRDDLSASVVKEIMRSARTETIGDLVLWLEPDAQDWVSTLGLPSEFAAIILAPIWSHDRAWYDWISGELRQLSKELRIPFVFIPMNALSKADVDEHRAVAKAIMEDGGPEAIVIDRVLSPRAIASLLRRAKPAISMRLHGCVMAYAQRTPCVGLAYHPKLTGFFDTVRLRHALLPAVIPAVQTDPPKGFRFADLGLKPGELVDTALDSLSRPISPACLN